MATLIAFSNAQPQNIPHPTPIHASYLQAELANRAAQSAATIFQSQPQFASMRELNEFKKTINSLFCSASAPDPIKTAFCADTIIQLTEAWNFHRLHPKIRTYEVNGFQYIKGAAYLLKGLAYQNEDPQLALECSSLADQHLANVNPQHLSKDHLRITALNHCRLKYVTLEKTNPVEALKWLDGEIRILHECYYKSPWLNHKLEAIYKEKKALLNKIYPPQPRNEKAHVEPASQTQQKSKSPSPIQQEKPPVYQKNLKGREIDKETTQNFQVLAVQSAKERGNFKGKPTKLKPDSSNSFGTKEEFSSRFSSVQHPTTRSYSRWWRRNDE